MNPALISLHRLGVFCQAWFTLSSFTSDFGLSLVDYFPLIPKVHKIGVVLVANHTFRNNYPSAIDNRFICSLFDMDFCAVQKQTKKNKTSRSNTNFLICVPNTEYTRCLVEWLGEAKVSCILRHRASNWYLLIVGQGLLSLQKVKAEGKCFYFFCFFTFIHFPFSPVPLFHLLYCLLSLFSLSLGDDRKWPTSGDMSLNPTSIKSIKRCQVTKQGPFTDLRTNRNSVSVIVNSLY